VIGARTLTAVSVSYSSLIFFANTFIAYNVVHSALLLLQF